MTDFPFQATRIDGHTPKFVRLWRAYRERRAEHIETRRLAESLRELNSAQLRDIGLIREEPLIDRHR